MSAPFTKGPWRISAAADAFGRPIMAAGGQVVGFALDMRLNPKAAAVQEANARLIAAAPDHALVCWAMCVQDATWEEWPPEGQKGEFCFAGIRYVTKLDEFGAPILTPPLRAALAKARGEQ